MLVDSGSSVNIVNTAVVKMLEARGMTFKTVDNHFIYPYASEPIKIQGFYTGTIRCKDHSVQAELLLIAGNSVPILGLRRAKDLGLIHMDNFFEINKREL